MAKEKAIPAGPVTKVTAASLSKLSKLKLEAFALASYGVDIDRRKKKDELVKEVLKLSKKKPVITDASIEAKEANAVLKAKQKAIAIEAEAAIASIAGISAVRDTAEEPKGFWKKLFNW